MPRIPITDDIRNELNALHMKTNVGPQRLLKGKTDRPKGLTSTVIYHWMNGKIRSASDFQLNWVLDAWLMTPPLSPFSEEDAAKLDAEFKRTGFTPQSLLNYFSPVPDGLTTQIISRLRYGRQQKVPAADLSPKFLPFSGRVF